jgi:hypothetical protein
VHFPLTVTVAVDVDEKRRKGEVMVLTFVSIDNGLGGWRSPREQQMCDKMVQQENRAY